MTKAQLIDELAKLRHNYELLEQKCIGLANDMSAISVQRDVAERKYGYLEEVLASHGVTKQFVAVCGKNTESPAYVSEPFATEQRAWDAAKGTGYPVTKVDAVWVKAVPAVPTEPASVQALVDNAERRAGQRTERAKPLSRAGSSSTRVVIEFDPTKPGDFKRASALARANGGCVRRAGEH